MGLYHDYLRWLYRGGRPNRFARAQNRMSAVLFGAGLWPSRAAELAVRGRRSGRTVTFPVVIAELDGERYLVSMLGDDTNWVRNVRAAGGVAQLRHGRREDVRLVEVPVAERAPVLRHYLDVAPGARPHVPVPRGAPAEQFAAVADRYPVFRVVAERR
jgi:F420H(2)-dependent quinone reductase